MNVIFTKLSRVLLVVALLLSISVQDVSAQTPQYTYTNNANGGNWIPFGNGTWGPYRSQFLYLPGDFPTLGSQPGFITNIYFKCYTNYSTSSMVLQNLEVRIGNTTVTSLTGYVTGLTTARGPGNFNVANTSGGQWFQIPLTTPVYIDPTQPLVVDIIKSGVGGTGCPVFAGGTPVNGTYAGSNTHAYSNSSTGSPSLRRYSYQFGFDYFAGFPCTDTPKAEVEGPTQVCPNRVFSVQPDKYYADATYKWEWSPDGTNWSNYTGLPGLLGDIIDSITVTRYYRVTITCDSNKNLTWTSQPHKITIAPFYYCYCENEVTADAGADVGNLVVVNTTSGDTVINNGDTNPIYNNSKATNRYTSYHDSLAWPCFYRDTTYKFVVSQTQTTASLQQGVLQIFVDLNRDGVYNPNTERVVVRDIDGTSNPAHLITEDYKIPTSASIGYTGMRVIISNDTVKTAVCDTLSGGGEVEDYIVEICHRPCDGPVNPGVVVSTDTSMCNSYEYTLADTTYEKARSQFTWSWQISGDNQSWFNIANSIKKDTLQRVFTGQPLYYRVRMICPGTLDTTYSSATKINTKPGYKCYCYSKAIGGQGVDTSDIGGVTIGSIATYNGGPHLLNPLAVLPRTDYTDEQPTEIFTDSTYKFFVYHTMNVQEHGDSKVTIFMDFNNNHEYDIPAERVFTGFTSIGYHTIVDNIVIPLTAITDVPTGMRVILNNDVGPNKPSDEACGPYESGETEDFMVIFRKQIPAGVSEHGKLTGFGIHPNPNNGKFNVRFTTEASIDKVQLRIRNVTGQLIHADEYNYQGGTFSTEIDMTGKAAGVYIVELQADEERLIRRLVIK